MNTYTILTISLSSLVSIISVLTNLLTVYINNKHQQKIKAYDKKYEIYHNFFNIYAGYCINEEYNKDILSNAIVDCLLIANRHTTTYLNRLLRRVNDSQENENSEKITKQCFKNCIEALKDELIIYKR